MRVLFLLLIVMLAFSSCRSVQNRARRADDLVVRVRLERSFAREYAESPDTLRDFSYDIDKPCDILLMPIAAFMHIAIRSSLDHLDKTKFVVYPDCRSNYRQRLYWGDNTLYFPVDAKVTGGKLNIIIDVSGDRTYTGVHTLKVGTAGKNKSARVIDLK